MGTWYEVERSFYLPELASGCTTLTFQEETVKNRDNGTPEIDRIEVAVKSINQWFVWERINRFYFALFTFFSFKTCECRTGSASVNIGYVFPETKNSSIMDIKVCLNFNLLWILCAYTFDHILFSFQHVCRTSSLDFYRVLENTKYYTRTIRISPFYGHAPVLQIWDIQVAYKYYRATISCY